MTKTEVSIELNVNELDIILKSLELVENGDEIQINRSSGSINTLYDRLYYHYSQLDKSSITNEYYAEVQTSHTTNKF